jgi:hypothetical protein
MKASEVMNNLNISEAHYIQKEEKSKLILK